MLLLCCRLLALTGARLKGSEVSGLGLASHFCKSTLIPSLSNELAVCKPEEVEDILDHFMRESGGRGPEENLLAAAWAKAEDSEDVKGTFARWVISNCFKWTCSVLKGFTLLIQVVGKCCTTLDQAGRVGAWSSGSP